MMQHGGARGLPGSKFIIDSPTHGNAVKKKTTISNTNQQLPLLLLSSASVVVRSLGKA